MEHDEDISLMDGISDCVLCRDDACSAVQLLSGKIRLFIGYVVFLNVVSALLKILLDLLFNNLTEDDTNLREL